MLLEFSVSNFRSIRDEINFSMVASADNSFEEKLIQDDKFKTLRTCAIYGPNGSGKTNIIKAMSLMKVMVCNSLNHQLGDNLIFNPHRLAVDKPTIFKIQFSEDNIRYSYGFSYNKNEILEEYLYYFPESGKPNKVFERKEMNIENPIKYDKDLAISKNILLLNKLFLSCGANYSPIPEMKKVFMFFKEQLVFYSNEMPNNWLSYSVNTLQNNSLTKETFLNLIRGLGSDMIDLTAKLDIRKVTDAILPQNMPENLKLLFKEGEMEDAQVNIRYDKFSLNLKEESAGIIKLFEMLCPFIDIINKGKILICDEIETSLHENIVFQLITTMNNNAKTNAQLVFSTHDTNLLDLNLIRRDQVWFTEIEKDYRSTKLYSLWEINNVRRGENIMKGYIMGRYGAIPILNQSLIKEILGE